MTEQAETLHTYTEYTEQVLTPWQAEPFFAGGNLGILEREVFGMNENIVKRNALMQLIKKRL